MTKSIAIQRLRDVALRVNNLQPMKRFYKEVLGFKVVGEFPNAALLESAEGYGEHPQVVSMFKRSVPASPKPGSVDHIILKLSHDHYEFRTRWLKHRGFRMEQKEHHRICLQDPEGNRIELVCAPRGLEKQDCQ